MLQNRSNLVVVDCILTCKFDLIAVRIICLQKLRLGVLIAPSFKGMTLWGMLCCCVVPFGGKCKKEERNMTTTVTLALWDTFPGLRLLSHACHVTTLVELYLFCACGLRTAVGQRSFAISGTTTWNSLTPALRAPELSQNAFTRALKTHLFSATRHRLDVSTRFLRRSGGARGHPDERAAFPDGRGGGWHQGPQPLGPAGYGAETSGFNAFGQLRIASATICRICNE